MVRRIAVAARGNSVTSLNDSWPVPGSYPTTPT